MLRATLVLSLIALAQPAVAQNRPLTHADTLRGSEGPGRAWWDVTFYDLAVSVSPTDSSLEGSVAITYRVVGPSGEMQLDLQPPMELRSVTLDGEPRTVRRDGNAWFVDLPPQAAGTLHTVTAHFGGAPRVAVRPPWDGGYQWEWDDEERAWVATSNQGLGASVWWPNKDFQADEPDSQRTAITVPDPMVAVSNGRLEGTRPNGDGTTTWTWLVSSPINNYSVEVNAGDYAHWTEVYDGETGPLTMDFWPLARNLDAARAQWAQARTMMACFEHWFGPYPFYEDGYKLIEVPYLGMEHQSGVTYGNGYANGYRGTDLSGTGHGLEWDFIIIHESAHEWWGNSITASDIADNWVHESFANYSENLYTECLTGSARAGEEYVIGTRSRITNRRPIVGPYGVNRGGDDIYYKGGNLLHTIRQLVDDDEQWRRILRGLGAEFRHRNVPGSAVEAYVTRESGLDLDLVWDQYLRTTMVPVLEWRLENGFLGYRWQNVVHGFAMPVRVSLEPGASRWIRPTERWQVLEAVEGPFEVDPGYFVETREVE
jgi:aminopeptidase N